MAQIIVRTDDLDGSKGAEEVTLTYKGTSYSIDLAATNQAALDKALAPFLGKAKKVGGKTRGRGSAKTGVDLTAVREWANKNGHRVAARGRVSQTVIDAYQSGK